jgi:DNA polymerase/3'-5' exonuclease PolX
MTKTRHPRAAALAVAKELCAALKPACERLIVAGSLRRRREEVGDVEIVYIPRFETGPVPGDLFAHAWQNLADFVIAGMLARGVIAKRESIRGTTAFGEKNKLMVHLASGIPVDLFSATAENWFNYLVCRTGPKESNTRIAEAAKAKGWHWNPYGAGFSNTCGGTRHAVTSERDVFDFLGFPYLEPWER